MAKGLKPVVVPLIIKNGLLNNTDDSALPIENFKRLENCYINKVGRVSKMPGTQALTNVTDTGATLSATEGIANLGNQLVRVDNNELFAYNPIATNWSSRGDVSLVESRSVPVVRNTEQQSSPDASYVAGAAVYAWEDTTNGGGVYAKVVDEETQSTVVTSTLLRASAIRPRVVTVGQLSFIFYVAVNTMYVRRFDRSANAFGAEVSLFADVNSTESNYDACELAGAIGVAYRTNGNEIKFAYVTLAPAVGNPITGFPNPTTLTSDALGALACWNVNDQLLFVSYYNATDGLMVTARKVVNLTQEFAPVQIELPAVAVRNIGAIATDATNSAIFYENVGSIAQNNYVKTVTVTSAGVLGTPALVSRSVGLVSKPMIFGGELFVQCAFDTTLQATSFLLRSDGFIVSRINSGTAGGLTARPMLPNASDIGDDTFLLPAVYKASFVSENNTTFTRTGVLAYYQQFAQDRAVVTIPSDSGLYFSGGLLQMYDGVSAYEVGYNTYPEGMTSVQSAGAIPAGDYQYAFMWEWVDARGNIHRSAPSTPIDVNITGADQRLTWTVPTLRLTARKGSRTAPVLAVYRTQEIGANGGTLFYRVSSRVTAGSTNGIVLNDTTVDTVTFIDNLTDSAIAANELLYTTGGVLENLPPEPATTGVFFKTRLVLNTTDGSGQVFYSKQAAQGEAISFHPELSIQVDPQGGGVTSIEVMDEKLILQKPALTWVTAGDPAANTGQGSSLLTPERLPISTGCPYPGNAISVAQGLIYRSLRGIYLLTRGLEEQYVGGAVEDYNDLTPSTAIALPLMNQLRFYNSDGPALVYNMDSSTWSVFAERQSYDHAFVDNEVVILSTDGILRRESLTYPFTNSGSHYPMRIETGWISLASFQGFMRVWRLMLKMKYKSSHNLLVRIATDFEPAWKQATYVTPATAMNQQPYGTGTYGTGQYGGETTSDENNQSRDSVYQARLHLTVQKCESIKIYIEDLRIDENFGESFELNGLSLEVGVKKGMFKPHLSKSFGG